MSMRKVVLSKAGSDITSQLSGDAVKERVKELILGGPVIFSKSYCPFCTKTKALFAKLGAQVTAVELDQDKEGPAIQAALLQATGQRTVPSVFVGGHHIGGNDDVQGKAASGELKTMLSATE